MACQHHLINLQQFTEMHFCSVEPQADQFVGPIALWLLWTTTFRMCLHRVKIDLG
jgi:hypothetical protein